MESPESDLDDSNNSENLRGWWSMARIGKATPTQVYIWKFHHLINKYICVCVYIYICMCIYICMYVYIYMYMYIYIYYVYIYVYIYIYMYIIYMYIIYNVYIYICTRRSLPLWTYNISYIIFLLYPKKTEAKKRWLYCVECVEWAIGFPNLQLMRWSKHAVFGMITHRRMGIIWMSHSHRCIGYC